MIFIKKPFDRAVKIIFLWRLKYYTQKTILIARLKVISRSGQYYWIIG